VARRRNKAKDLPPAEATVTDLDHDGRGVGRVEDKVVFIDGALPGERVRFRYTRTGRQYDQGQVLEVLEAAPERTEPGCPYFGLCGGCALQHLAPDAQVTAKEGFLRDNLQRLAGVGPQQWLAPITGPDWGYRAKARLGIRSVAKKGVLVGFREKAGRYVTDMDQCPVLDPRLERLLLPLRELVAGMSRPDRVPQAEVAASESDAAVVIRHLTELTDEDVRRLRAFQAEHGVVVEAQPKGPETAHPIDPERPADLHYRLPEDDITLYFHSTDFVQVNAEVNRQLVTRALDLLAPEPGERVVDLFCGLGNFSLPVARRGAEVLGLEGESGLVERARANAAANGLSERTGFEVADLAAEEGELPDLDGADKLLLDPPRSGAMAVVKRLPAASEPGAPARVVYVSCNPATLARDAGYLTEVLGYRLSAAGIANMFPHTAHVESVACFDRPEAG
jgi:23S rRNA (uracil1939-C5)-methyltransferase